MSILIWHETNQAAALSIASTGKFMACDPHSSCANFYNRAFSKSNVEDAELSLAFIWTGIVLNTHDVGSKLLAPETLWHTSTNSSGEFDPCSYYVSRIYPDTPNDLSLVGVIYKLELSNNLSFKRRFLAAKLNNYIVARPNIKVLT